MTGLSVDAGGALRFGGWQSAKVKKAQASSIPIIKEGFIEVCVYVCSCALGWPCSRSGGKVERRAPLCVFGQAASKVGDWNILDVRRFLHAGTCGRCEGGAAAPFQAIFIQW